MCAYLSQDFNILFYVISTINMGLKLKDQDCMLHCIQWTQILHFNKNMSPIRLDSHPT